MSVQDGPFRLDRVIEKLPTSDAGHELAVTGHKVVLGIARTVGVLGLDRTVPLVLVSLFFWRRAAEPRGPDREEVARCLAIRAAASATHTSQM
jgi:hypothetical protein